MTSDAPKTCPRTRSDDGTAVAEVAVALPALVVVLAAAVWALGLVSGQLRCAEAARAAARIAARGESPAAVQAAGRRAAGRSVSVVVRPSGGTVTVAVSAVVRPPRAGLLRLFPTVTVRAAAVADAEPAGGAP